MFVMSWLILLQLCFRDDKEYHEFHYSIKIPAKLLKSNEAEILKYKYHVESPITENKLIKSLELIVGPPASDGIIDRCLAVHCEKSQLRIGCKWYIR